MTKENIPDCELKIKEFGKPVFKAKGRKDKVKQEAGDFFKFKGF